MIDFELFAVSTYLLPPCYIRIITTVSLCRLVCNQDIALETRIMSKMRLEMETRCIYTVTTNSIFSFSLRILGTR